MSYQQILISTRVDDAASTTGGKPRSTRRSVNRSRLPEMPHDARTTTNHTRGPRMISPDDVVIAVAGMTGSGKSTFIGELTNTPVIGHGLESCTTKVKAHRAIVDRKPVFLIDTPGFDDTNRSDIDVLLELATWLATAYEMQIKLTGIVFLHPINRARMEGSALKNLKMFKSLCGKEGLKALVLATTFWDREDGRIARNRETELKTNPKFWKPMVHAQARVCRHDRQRDSALEIVRYLTGRQRPVILDIQREIVDRGLNLTETAAGQVVEKGVRDERRRLEKKMRKLEAQSQTATTELKNQLKVAKDENAEQRRANKVKAAELDRLRVDHDALAKRMSEDVAQKLAQKRNKDVTVYLCSVM